MVGHASRMGDTRNVYKTSIGKVKGRDILEDLGIDGKKILEWTLE